MSSAAGGTRALGRQHIGAGHAGVGATSVDDLVGLHGAAAPFEARFTVYEVAAERVMGAPTDGLSSVACVWQRMGIGPSGEIKVPKSILTISPENLREGPRKLSTYRVARKPPRKLSITYRVVRQ